jgi:hypothetical protein
MASIILLKSWKRIIEIDAANGFDGLSGLVNEIISLSKASILLERPVDKVRNELILV